MNIVYYGDSITEGFEQLKQHKHVWNMGRSGNTTLDLIGRFPTVTRLNPDRLILMIGTNDYLVEEHVWGDFVIIDYGVMIDALFTLIKDNLPNCDMIVLSIPPVRWPGLDIFTANQEIDKRNTQLATKARQYGFTYVDVSDALKANDNALNKDYTTDGVHLSELGYETYYNVVQSYLSE